jgi:hypothetical protein
LWAQGWSKAGGRRVASVKWRVFGPLAQKWLFFGVAMRCDWGVDGLKVLSRLLRTEGLNLQSEQRGKLIAGERNGVILGGRSRVGGELVHLK